MNDKKHTDFYLASSEFSLLDIKGEKAEQMLQGQITADVNDTKLDAVIPSAICNLKGRVIASFYLSKLADGLRLRIHHSLCDKLLVHLQKFAPFFQVTLNVYPSLLTCFSNAPVPNTNALARGKGAFESYILNNNGQDKPQNDINSASTSETLETWPDIDNNAARRWLIEHNEIVITQQSSELFTPAELNMDLDGTINFKKGCYAGQEVVARMYYKGKAKKRAVYLITSPTSSLAIGDSITDSNQQQIGQVVQFSHTTDQLVLVANLPIDFTGKELLLNDKQIVIQQYLSQPA